MAFKTLDLLRTSVPGLNFELGLDADTDNTWGTTAVRNGCIQRAFAKLWPQMAKLTRETISTVANQQDYSLTSLIDIERVEVMDTGTPTFVTDRVRSWQVYDDQVTEPPTHRLLLPAGMMGGQTLRAIGYARYTIPVTGATVCDLPETLEHVLIAGARVEAYRRMVARFSNYERFANENRQNALTPADVLEMLRQAKREFEEGIRENARPLTGARRAQLQTG